MKHFDTDHGLTFKFQTEVADALAEGQPVVALESNVITHGLRYPHNIAAAQDIEAAVRANGAVPATIFIEDGAIVYGSDPQRLERYATSDGIPKVSSRDLPFVLANRSPGATTVASSLICAQWAGIPIFSSAGIGGVHRGAQDNMDVSADLIQFTRSRVTTVCAGAKMILDLPLTLEFLETHCVPLVAYKSDDFPAFFCETSGLKCPQRMDDPHSIARAINLHAASGAPGGVLVTVPPRPEDAIPTQVAEDALATALKQAESANITGPGLTKFLMRQLEEATGGQTARANAAVLISTASAAAEIAVALAADTPKSPSIFHTTTR
ncbi:pseudouridine-5'-phosphate glycosidase [Epibacterium ulvae]|uniref:pseudouridine-5'-phosphate glycosidase n=1 Tax=Epibacterium ulvae TaxID=1156985 RepID=UPI00249319F8|nr:pseudouridine-5'-phosphate glycosidase [Epibacterium ulvae]